MIEINKDIKDSLKQVGLDLAEQQVVMYLLANNMKTIQDITNELRLPRSSVQLACENLFERGVLRIDMLGKRRQFYIDQAKDIENYVLFDENKLLSNKQVLKKILPKLSNIQIKNHGVEPIVVQELSGENGLVEVFYRSLEQKIGGEVLRFGGDPEKFTVAREKLKEYREKRTKKKIFTRLLIPDSQYTSNEAKDARFKMRDVRFLSKETYNPEIHASVFDEHFTITVWDKGLHSVIIKNQKFANFMKQLFEIAWSKANTGE